VTRVIGLSHPRIDSREKVTGAMRYAADLTVPGLLHARIVPSLYAHARILGIEKATALAMPGVVAILTADDLPIAGSGDERRFEPLARTETVFAGQPVALVIAETEAAAEDAAGLVIVETERLAVVLDVLAAMEVDAPPARVSGSVAGGEEDPEAERASGNVLSRERVERGNTAAAFAACDVTVEGRFRTEWVHQAYMEPHVALAWIEPDGTLAVAGSTQGTFYARGELAKIFGLRPSKVRVTPAPVGGAFGSKLLVVEPLVAGAALHLRRPVRLVMTRQEDFAATNPAQGMLIDLRIGALRNGRLEALEARALYDAGAYGESSGESFAAHLLTGPYRWTAFDVQAWGVRTNRFGAGSYRAPTGPQGTFALESLIDQLAERVGLDPLDFRLANLVGDGDDMADGEQWPGIGARECLERLRGHPVWAARRDLPRGEGVGLAIGVWPGSSGPAAATCRLEPDGTISVITGVVDISGSTSALAAIAAETFGVKLDAVTIVTADTDAAPLSPMSAGSAITYGAGPAVQQAAGEARDRLLQIAADSFEIDPGDLEIVGGVVRPRGSPEIGRSVAEFARDLMPSLEGQRAPVEGHATTAHSAIAPSATGHLAHVRVDEETGAVELLAYAVTQDVGRALNPALVEGQMLGGTVQSIGFALREKLVHDDHGQLLTATFMDYAVPRAAMLPPMETMIVEVPAPEGPFGAKGIGEASILPGPAAIANAIAAATGLRMRELPMDPPRVWKAAQARNPTPTS
jgi:CO/xanthine dehydrogenase Mo-binding subunit